MKESGAALDGIGTSGLLEPAREMLSRYGKMKINVAEAERWGSVALGGGLVLYGLKRRSWSGLFFGLAGGALMLRGILGKCLFYQLIGVNTATGAGLPGQAASNGLIRVDKSLVIDRPAGELFRFLREVENLPRVFGHLRSVRSLDARHSVWTAKMPAGLDLEWESEVWDVKENRKLAWRASAEGGIRSDGSLILDPLGAGKTQVGVHLEYDLPAGKAGRVFAGLFGKHPDRLIDEELRRFKSLMEAGPA